MYRFCAAAACMISFAAGCVSVRTPDPDVVYIAFGDSATAGASDKDYPVQLADALAESPTHFANEGRGGEGTSAGLTRLRALLPSGLYPNAEVLLYWEGGNDVVDFVGDVDPFVINSPTSDDYPFKRELDDRLDKIQANIVAAIDDGKSAGLRVYVATYFPLRASTDCPTAILHLLLPAQADRANQYIDLLNQRIREAAIEGGATLVDVADLGSLISDDPDNYEDCLHLSAKGNAQVAESFKAALD